MAIVKFANGTEIEYLSVKTEGTEFYNNAQREVLHFELARDAANLEELDVLLSNEENLETIKLVEDGEVVNTLSDYLIKMKLAVEPVLVEAETAEAPARYEDRIIFKLGMLTYMEKQLRKLGL